MVFYYVSMEMLECVVFDGFLCQDCILVVGYNLGIGGFVYKFVMVVGKFREFLAGYLMAVVVVYFFLDELLQVFMFVQVFNLKV